MNIDISYITHNMETVLIKSFVFFVLTQAVQSAAEDTYANCIQPPSNDGVNCPPEIHGTNNNTRDHFRTINGTCNNLKKPNLGAVNSILRRILKSQYDDGVDLPRGHIHASDYQNLPTAYQVSNAVFKPVTGQAKNDKEISVLFMTFGQFLDHDFSVSPHESCNVTRCTSGGNTFKYPCMPIKFNRDKVECFGFARSKPACKSDPHAERDQLNELTSFIDLSQVYGTTDTLAKKLRKFNDIGELKLNKQGLLPLDHEESAKKSCTNPAGCHLIGDSRGEENIALLSMHTLWVRQHNRIARQLKSLNPRWDKERLYQTARKINAALWQHIVYNEFVPKLYNITRFPKTFGQNTIYERTTYEENRDPRITNVFSAAAFRFGHSLVPEHFSQIRPDFNQFKPPVKLQNAFNNSSAVYTDGIEPTMLGLCANMSKTIDEYIAPSLSNKLFIVPGSKLFNDLMSLNIQRGRDHGIAPYMQWRRECGFAKYDGDNFHINDLRYIPKKIREVFKKIYKDVEDIDLFVAGITEHHLDNKIVGPTFSCIFKKQFEALRFGDRFFYSHKGSFTAPQFRAITKITMSKILCNNLYGLVSMHHNAFKVFDPEHDKRENCDVIDDIDLSVWKDPNAQISVVYH